MEKKLTKDLLHKIDAYWRASLYLSVGLLYLQDNPLLKKPLTIEHIKKRPLGHWGSVPGQSLIWVHLNRIIKEQDLNVIFISGPGHGSPAMLSNGYLEGSYSEHYPHISQDIDGMRKFFKHFSFPGGIGSHCTPEVPGSIHEGGELGYSLSHAYGAAFDNPDLIVAAVIGDGEAETGPLAASWFSHDFINPKRDGAVIPILHLNGYKIANPTILSRISHAQLENLFVGYGYNPYFVEGNDPTLIHEQLASTLDRIFKDIKDIQHNARVYNSTQPVVWPMLVLRTPKGWTCPKTIDGHKLEGFWRAHQIPINVFDDPTHLKILEDWMHSYHPEELFDKQGKLLPELKELAPKNTKRMSANPHTNGGLLRTDLELPNFRNYAVAVTRPTSTKVENTGILGEYLRDVMRNNMQTFRVFGPDETASNRLTALYEVTKKTWESEIKPEDSDGSELSREGRVMELLSEHTLEGWLEGYLLTGRHGLLSSYEAFVHIIDSMFNQHAKWLDKSQDVPWRKPISSLNLLITSTVWRQDHNGFSHQDPGFLDLVTNKSPKVTRIYLPPDANCLLSVADHCLRSKNYVNVIVSDKQSQIQYLTMDQALKHCTKGIGIWDWAGNSEGIEPDIIIASAGDIATMEALAATAILRDKLPEIKVRFINVVDLFKLQPQYEHLHGLTLPEFNEMFTEDKPIVFNFHGYPWLIHKLAYRLSNTNLHVRGYKEHGDINSPLELAINNQTDRFSLALDVIDRVHKVEDKSERVKTWLKKQITENLDYIYQYGVDKSEITDWRWPY